MMTRILLSLGILMGVFNAHAQIFWVENFESGSSSGLSVSSYTGPNGTWTNTVISSEGTYYNEWYVSCAESGHITGICGTGCTAAINADSTGASLHLGSNAGFGGDAGATYDAGGLCSASGGTICVNTDRRAESPTINCTGKYGITISFYYIENGDTTNDNATLWYYDGSTWSQLFDTYKTPTCSSGQGNWQHFSYSLPVSANNNANVKIGFRWVNNDDGTGTDPSFAVDSVVLSTSGTSSTTVASFTVNDTTACQDSCITFTSTTTGSTDSIRWSIPGTGVTITTPHSSPMVACFSNAGYYTVKLYTYNGTATDSAMHTIHILNSPHPSISRSGHVLSVTGAYTSYQWYKNDTAISGATSATYTFTTYGSYTILVDSGGCQTMSAAVLYNLGVAEVSANGIQYSVAAQQGSDAFMLYSTAQLDADLQVTVYDATGRQVLSGTWETATDKKRFEIPGIANGLYIIRLGNSNNSAVLKWLKR